MPVQNIWFYEDEVGIDLPPKSVLLTVAWATEMHHPKQIQY
ncbi:hypothetical protein [Photorhabdus australis]